MGGDVTWMASIGIVIWGDNRSVIDGAGVTFEHLDSLKGRQVEHWWPALTQTQFTQWLVLLQQQQQVDVDIITGINWTGCYPCMASPFVLNHCSQLVWFYICTAISQPHAHTRLCLMKHATHIMYGYGLCTRSRPVQGQLKSAVQQVLTALE